MNVTRRTHATNRDGYTYLVVMGVALIVSTLGLSTLLLVRIRTNETTLAIASMQAAALAHSAIEHGMTAINTNSAWRTTYESGVPIGDQLLGDGTFSWILKDADGQLAAPDTDLRLTGIGRVGQTTKVYSLKLEKGTLELGPQELRSQTSAANQLEGEVLADQWWCQYLTVTLPAEATGWKITGVELLCQKWYGNSAFKLRLYEPLPSNMPSSTIVDSVDLNSNAFTPSLAWHTVDFGGEYLLNPADGVCIAVEATSTWAPIRIAYESSGVSEPDSAMITGNPTWTTYDTDKALIYRVHGAYTTPDGNMQPITGGWRWDAAPAP